MTNQDYVRLYELLTQLMMVQAPAKFAYAVGKNRKRLRDIYQHYYDLNQPPEKLKEYNEKRITICEKYTEHKDGKPVIVQGEYQILDVNKRAFEQAIADLDTENPESTEIIDAMRTAVNDWLSMESQPIELHKVTVDNVPDLNPVQMEILDPMIEQASMIHKLSMVK